METFKGKPRLPAETLPGAGRAGRCITRRRDFLRLAAAAGLTAGFGKMALAASALDAGGAAPVVPASREVLNLPHSVLSLLSGRKLQLRQVMQFQFDAGFTSEQAMIGGTAVAIAESGLYTAARNWHPEKGYRPAGDIITVKGPAEVWRGGSQLHSDRGVWQIASYWHSFFPDAATDDPAQCAKIAFQLSDGGTDFGLWTSFASGYAQNHFDHSYLGWPALRPLVRRFLAYQASNPPQPLAISPPEPARGM